MALRLLFFMLLFCPFGSIAQGQNVDSARKRDAQKVSVFRKNERERRLEADKREQKRKNGGNTHSPISDRPQPTGTKGQRVKTNLHDSAFSRVLVQPDSSQSSPPWFGSSLFDLPLDIQANQDSMANIAMLGRLLSYISIESQSIDDPSMSSFPMTEGQRHLARFIYDEANFLVHQYEANDIKVTLSDDYYVYIDIPANTEENVPSVLFMAHMDVTPEAPGTGIKPIVHKNYDGKDIVLPSGITLSPDTPQGAHLKDLVGKTIVTSDGTTLLGADDKTGCAVLMTLMDKLVLNDLFIKGDTVSDFFSRIFKHGRVMICLSQNEDVGKAAMRYNPAVFGTKPDVVIDVDGSIPDQFSVANFTAIGQTYYFKGNMAHPSDGKKAGYADALSAAAYFMGLVPPSMNPSAREGEEGYVHCYSLSHPLDDRGNPIASDYVVKVRLRYFDLQEGEMQKQMVADNLRKTQEAFPLVTCTLTDNEMQYQNIAYTMPDYVPELLQKAAQKAGMTMQPRSARGGTTTAMMVARFPDIIPGGPDLYSGQNAVHSCYEWCCIEEMLQIVDIAEEIIKEVANLNQKQ